MQKTNWFSMNVFSKYSNMFSCHFHSFVDEIKKCMEPLEKCSQPYNVERLREYIDKIKYDVCTLTQGIVSKIQETMTVDTLGIKSFQYRY